MSRHHPYGGYDGPMRRGGPAGPGPDRHMRSERGGGRGGRGGRGGGPPRGGYGGPPSYSNSYNQYSAPAPAPAPYGPSGGANGDALYSDYGGPSDKYDSGYEDGRNPQGRRREREDQVHDTLIEERIQRERPCRTLFIRNIKYETSSEDVRRQFEEYGEIKSFYDLVSSRGMVFVTYFDLRAAERARERLQGAEIAGRPIDVHYSLPRADEQSGRCDRDKNQGTLLVSLQNSASGQPLDDNELRRRFQQFGDVKGVKPAGGPHERYVELYDTRACEDAHDKLHHQNIQDGQMDISFAWDIPDQPLPPGPVPRFGRQESPPRSGHDDFRGGRARGRGRGRGRGQGFRGDRDYRDDSDTRYNRDDWEPRDHDRRDMRDSYSREREPPRHSYDAYGPPPVQPQPSYPAYPPAAPPPPVEDRLEQAKKVQQLLEALKQPGGASAPPPSAPPGPRPGIPAPTGQNSYYAPPPPAGVPGPSYPSPSYGSTQYPPYPGPPPAGPQQAGSAANPALPANLMALLQAQQLPTPPPPVPAFQQAPPVVNHPVYQHAPPTSSTPSAVPQNATSDQVQQLMALLQKRT